MWTVCSVLIVLQPKERIKIGIIKSVNFMVEKLVLQICSNSNGKNRSSPELADSNILMPDLRPIPPREINRKLLHGLAIALPVGIFYGPGFFKVEQSMACYIIGGIFLVTLLIEGYRLHNKTGRKLFRHMFGGMMRNEESGKLTGATWVLGGSVLCSLLALISPVAAAAAFWGLTLFILGDAAAALIGKAFGRTRIGRKTLEGALGCYVLCVLLSILVLPQLPMFLATWGGQLALWQILLISAVITILEFFPIRLGKLTINDNLYVPAMATLAAMLIR